jgi:hypothetical protein
MKVLFRSKCTERKQDQGNYQHSFSTKIIHYISSFKNIPKKSFQAKKSFSKIIILSGLGSQLLHEV